MGHIFHICPGLCRLWADVGTEILCPLIQSFIRVGGCDERVAARAPSGVAKVQATRLMFERNGTMKIVVIGGTGLIGSKTIELLRGAGHDALAAAPDTGVNTVTGEGLEAALDGADVVIDLANSRSFEPSPAMDFFTTHEKNLLAA